MTIELNHLSVSELETVRKKAEFLIESRRDATVEHAYKQAIEIARSVNLSLEDLVNYGSTKRKKTTRKPVEPRYRNPANAEQTWTGRGKQPRWLAEEIKKGKTLESFLIS
ncbi:MAG: H-NS histone family protein [Acinetobacter sp.]|nr:H-NS histone family protein [Acinetobacter sp.]